jgi:hypothetical protein
MVVVVVGSTVEKKEGGLKELFSPPHVWKQAWGLANFPAFLLAQKLCDPHTKGHHNSPLTFTPKPNLSANRSARIALKFTQVATRNWR